MRKLRFRCYPLTMTDVKTGRTIHFALMDKASVWVVRALDQAVATLPMGLKGIHSGTGSAFINRPVDLWCQRHGVAFSRGRPTHKNDNCSVEQKNYAAVRKIAGYFRYQEAAGVAAPQAVREKHPSNGCWNSPLRTDTGNGGSKGPPSP